MDARRHRCFGHDDGGDDGGMPRSRQPSRRTCKNTDITGVRQRTATTKSETRTAGGQLSPKPFSLSASRGEASAAAEGLGRSPTQSRRSLQSPRLPSPGMPRFGAPPRSPHDVTPSSKLAALRQFENVFEVDTLIAPTRSDTPDKNEHVGHRVVQAAVSIRGDDIPGCLVRAL